VLKSLGVIGVAADTAQARGWYQKAADLGSREAPQRIDQLARWTR
jgi:TPR repeat protein